MGDTDKARLKRLRETTMEDVRDNYEEEFGKYHQIKKQRTSDSNTSSSDDDDDIPEQTTSQSDAPSNNDFSSKAARMMQNMGYKEGKGLGLRGQGIVEPVALSTQRGRVGLGHDANKVVGRDMNELWNENVENEKTVDEYPKWIEASDDTRREVAEGMSNFEWVVVGEKKKMIDDETEFVDPTILANMLEAKKVFDSLSDRDLREARARANPYETIGSAFFQNRAAMKAANLDKIFNFIFSQEKQDHMTRKNPLDGGKAENSDRAAPMFYFADVCAGPGGFSEYMLWRKGFYNCKGFGFTLKGKDDFKLNKFTASSQYYFEPFYGAAKDGDVTNPDNINALEEFIMRGTCNRGVDLMMADGGFSVEGQENIQEILSKRLYLCQMLVSLCIVRDGGNFFCKLFDVFTPFSVGLCFLLYACYDRISIHKPHTSRPANSERYIICQGLRREDAAPIREYLKKVNTQLAEIAKTKNDILSVVPLDIITDDEAFTDYLTKSNNELAARQTVYLQKYLSFAKNQGQIDRDQARLREECMRYWMVPNIPRQNLSRLASSPDDLLYQLSNRIFKEDDFSLRPPFLDPSMIVVDEEKWMRHLEQACVFLSERQPPVLCISAPDAVYFRINGRWSREDSAYYRIPANSALLVEITTAFQMGPGTKLEESRGMGKLVRILDAGVLGGDDISKLQYMDRMRHVDKFCRAIHRVERSARPSCHVVAVHRFMIDGLVNIRRDLSRTGYKGEEVMFVKEHDYMILIRGIRGSVIVAEPWRLGWSMTHKVKFAFSAVNRVGRQNSHFECNWVREGCVASFWQNAFAKRNPPHYQWTWSWIERFDVSYGPRVIVEKDDSPHGYTITSLDRDIEKMERKYGKERHPDRQNTAEKSSSSVPALASK